MKVKGYLLVLTILSITLFTACNDDDGYSLDKHWIDIATVENQSGRSAFFFNLDDGTKMWTVASNFPNYIPKDGQRILADYTILSDKGEDEYYDHDVKLNDVYTILTKGIFEVTPETQDSIGYNKINVKNMWIGSDYLNVEFTYPGGNKIHYINLVPAEEVYDDGKIHLEFRHNANEDNASYALWGMVSFDLRSLQDEDVESFSIVVHWDSFDTPIEKQKEMEYIFNNEKSTSVVIELNSETGDIE